MKRDLDKAITDELTNKKIHNDLKNRIQQIQILNFQKIMKKLIKFERDLEFQNSGLLFTDEQLHERALQRFYIAKKDGKLDELNQKVLVNA